MLVKDKMPQLDKATWFSQIFWLLLILFFFYWSVLKFFLPTIGATLKFRGKLLQQLRQSTAGREKQTSRVYASAREVFSYITASKMELFKNIKFAQVEAKYSLFNFFYTERFAEGANKFFLKRFSSLKLAVKDLDNRQ